ncbi:MAG: LptF/LptG family permease [candidate division WOR-3 bacterium]|jgi:lipopolysaccharide export system permease protein|nr:LptF/LptG family permease [candidate division WOR-3 bacterium]MCR4423328.1 LptF/LptG family permease [candidate division WOR-3 bacterium]MDH7518667.1 LptF/LptG family permease [bacterium]
MKILERETIKQIIPAFLFAIVVLSFILLMDRLFLLADLLVRKGVPVKIVGEIMVLSLPFVISISVPLAVLIGGVITFGRMAQDNEITAIRAAGIPTWRVFVPALVFGTLLMPFMALFNGFVLPESQYRVRGLLTDIARKKPSLRIQERVFLDDFPGYMVYIGAIDERHSQISNVMIFEKSQGKGTPAFITAPQGKIDYTPDDRYMILSLYNGEIHELTTNGNYRRLEFQQHTINILTDDELVRRSRDYRSDDELRLVPLLTMIKENRKAAADLKKQLDSLTRLSSDNEVWQFKRDEIKTRLRYKNAELVRSLTELHKRLSLAFSALFFLMFGAPLGVVLRRGGVGTGFIVGLIFFAIYYVMLLGGENFAESGRVAPFLGMWLPNILLILPVTELIARAFFEISLSQKVITSLGLEKTLLQR